MKKALLGVALVLALPLTALADVNITLSGANPVTVRAGQPYVEPGYSAFSSVDGNITSLVTTSVPDTNHAGTFSVNYSVTDSTLTTATASRGLVVQASGGSMPYCSGPAAPGWRVDLIGGGCGGTGMFVSRGQTVHLNGSQFGSASGKDFTCPDWYPGGCMVPTK